MNCLHVSLEIGHFYKDIFFFQVDIVVVSLQIIFWEKPDPHSF